MNELIKRNQVAVDDKGVLKEFVKVIGKKKAGPYLDSLSEILNAGQVKKYNSIISEIKSSLNEGEFAVWSLYYLWVEKYEEIKKSFKENCGTFDGIGASSEALRQMAIGIETTERCELDKDANKTYYENFEKYQENLTLDIYDYYKNVKKGKKYGLLTQSAPCQTFSSQGKKRLLDDEKGKLLLLSVKIQKKVDANVVVYENVKGLIQNGKHIYIYKDKDGNETFTRFQLTMTEKREKGYEFIRKEESSFKSLINKDYKNRVGVAFNEMEKELLKDKRYNYYWKIINAADQGVPQNRERVFIVGIKKELDNGFEFPEDVELRYTVQDILEKKVDNKFYFKDYDRYDIIPTNQKMRKNRIHTVANFDSSMSYETSRRIYSPYVAPCITTNNGSKFLINGKVRKLTPTENKRIHGFREEFKFVGSLTKQNKQLGNTISPIVYKNLFNSIFDSINISALKD